MKKANKIYTIAVPPVTEEFARTVEAAFPLHPVHPTMTMEEIQFNAGQRTVVDYIKRHAVGKSGNVNRQT